MAKYVIRQFRGSMDGSVKISGCKNAALPVMCAAVLSEEPTCISDVPDLIDVDIMKDILVHLGAEIEYDKEAKTMKVRYGGNGSVEAPYDMVDKLRASVLSMGVLLATKKKARVASPGGCPIGARPVDLHLKGFAAMGAEIKQGYGFVTAEAPDGLRGASIYLDFPSVGATENIMIGAVTAKGITIIDNAASEPEIVDLASLLTSMGADISGAGTDRIVVNGVDKLHGATHTIMPDRIETASFMALAAAVGGRLDIRNAISEHVKPVTAKLREMGCDVTDTADGIEIDARGKLPLKAVDIKTLPHPGFPTDMQAPFSALLCACSGTGMITETVFENRFLHVQELKRMGANIKVDGRTAHIQGGSPLTGTKVQAMDLRAGMAMIIAALFAEGTTEVENIYHIERGYEDLPGKLRSLGIDIVRSE